jgi:hypothetical protein
MPRLALGPWRPDAAALDSDYLSDLRNALLTPSGWVSDKALSPGDRRPVFASPAPGPVDGAAHGRHARAVRGRRRPRLPRARQGHRHPGREPDGSGYSTSDLRPLAGGAVRLAAHRHRLDRPGPGLRPRGRRRLRRPRRHPAARQVHRGRPRPHHRRLHARQRRPRRRLPDQVARLRGRAAGPDQLDARRRDHGRQPAAGRCRANSGPYRRRVRHGRVRERGGQVHLRRLAPRLPVRHRRAQASAPACPRAWRSTGS